MDEAQFVLKVRFYRTDAGAEPVRQWLLRQTDDVKKRIGEDIKTVQYGWPMGMPLVRSLGDGLREVRSTVAGVEFRVAFVAQDGEMVLLHAFVKKAQTEPEEVGLAKKRARSLTSGGTQQENE